MRNLLHGRAVAGALGPVSAVGYVPDSFGHPAQFPQLLAGFGLDPFVYWRGNGAELDKLGPLYRWRAPDGNVGARVAAPEGYFGAGGLDADGDLAATVARLQPVIDGSSRAAADPVLLMNGFDHLPRRHVDRRRRRRCSVRSVCCSTTPLTRLPAQRRSSSGRVRSSAPARRTCCRACGRRACR